VLKCVRRLVELVACVLCSLRYLPTQFRPRHAMPCHATTCRRQTHCAGMAASARSNVSTSFPVSSSPTLKRIKSSSTPHLRHCSTVSDCPFHRPHDWKPRRNRTYPVQLAIVCEDNIRRTQRKVRAQTRALDGIKRVEKSNSVGFAVKCRRQQPPVATVGVAAFVVKGASWAGLGVVYLLDWRRG
jgi:hypothetical protein